MATKIRIECSTCGSTDVRRDAYAEWNVQTQEWELHSVYDNFVCEDCGGECSVDEVDDDATPRDPISCPVNDPDCLGGDGDCHDACEPPDAVDATAPPSEN